MIMGLELEFRTRGRATKPLEAEIVRELTREDLLLLQEEKGVVSPPLKRISDRHHALARALASGMGPGDAAITCGFALARVSILAGDPAFKELLEFYRKDVNRQYADLHQQLAGISRDAAMEIQERLEAEPEKIHLQSLMELVRMGADRTGHGPNPSGPATNINFVVALPQKAADTDAWAKRHDPKLIEHEDD